MSLKQNLVFNTLWSISGIVGNGLIQLIANIFFARYLTPSEFGQIGIVMFFVLLSNVMVEGGLGGALVRKIDATDKDFSTVFIFNFIVSLFLYLLLILNADFIANFYHDIQLKNILIVTGSITVINSFSFIQNNRLIKNLQFKKIARYRLTSVILANCIGLTLLFFNFGIWALITSLILTPLFQTIILWSQEGAIGKLTFSKTSFKSLYAFGVNTSLATIIDTVFNNIYQLILGKYFSIAEVGFFYQAKKLQDVPNSVISGTTNSVIFSTLAKLQNEPAKFHQAYTKVVSYFSILIGIITLTIMTFSKEIVIILFGAKWESSGFFLFILTIASFFYVHEMFNRVIFKTFDRTEIILRLELVKKTILSISIVIGVIFLSLKLLLFGFVFVSIISYFINSYVSNRITKMGGLEELKTLFKVILAISLSYGIVLFIKLNLELSLIFSLTLFPLIIFFYFVFLRLQGIIINLKEIKQILK